MMKYAVVMLALLMAVSLCLLGVIQSRKNTEQQLNKSSYFERVKNRVTSDVLKEYQTNIAEAKGRLARTKKKVTELISDSEINYGALVKINASVDKCYLELKQRKIDSEALETEKTKTVADFQQKKEGLMTQIANLKAEFDGRSKVCDYIIKTSVEGMKLCGIVPVIPVVQKPEAPKEAPK